eukprot:scaffold7500_cov127-Isochrysis_galbana.AAC.5
MKGPLPRPPNTCASVEHERAVNEGASWGIAGSWGAAGFVRWSTWCEYRTKSHAARWRDDRVAGPVRVSANSGGSGSALAVNVNVMSTHTY